MQRSTMMRLAAVGTVCALGGAAAGIAGSSASSPKPTRATGTAAAIGEAPGRLPWLGPLAHASGPPVHADAVLPNEKGGFDTVTMDRGRFSSLSGDQLTITEGTKSATYKTVTLTIPAGATVRRNDSAAKLSDLKAGDSVLVLQSPGRTLVAAHDAEHAERLRFRLRLPEHGRPWPRPPKLPAIPDEGSSLRSGEGSPGGAERGAPS
jgi:hypothetical protein